MQPTLPSELIRVIIREATYVPKIFDTSSLQDYDRDRRMKSADTIANTMTTKTALCLVSKGFKAIAEEYLYEALVIYKLRQIRPLVLSLRSLLSYTAHRAFRGERCKRLDFLIGHRPDRFTATPWDLAWPWGSRSLWGLLPACPRLQILIINPNSNNLDAPTSLWMHLAAVAANLRVLIISELIISEPHMVNVLAACKSLEILRVDLIAPYNARIQGDIDRSPPLKFGKAISHNEVSEYIVDATISQWPTRGNNGRIMLRRLHSLSIISRNEKLLESFDLPSLQTVCIEVYWDERMFSRFNSTVTRLIIVDDSLARSQSIWMIVDAFPRVKDLIVYGELEAYWEGSSSYSELESLTASHISMDGIQFLLTELQAGHFIRLKKVVLSETYESTIEQAPSLQLWKQQLAGRGIELRGCLP